MGKFRVGGTPPTVARPPFPFDPAGVVEAPSHRMDDHFRVGRSVMTRSGGDATLAAGYSRSGFQPVITAADCVTHPMFRCIEHGGAYRSAKEFGPCCVPVPLAVGEDMTAGRVGRFTLCRWLDRLAPRRVADNACENTGDI